MKILQINKFYYRRRGAETYLLDLIDLLEKQGHEVAVFAMEHPENLPSPYSKYFVSNVNYDHPNLKAAGRMLWSREAQSKLEELLTVFKPDVAHIHNIYHQISPSILETLKRHHIPIVQTLHDYKLICPNYELFTQGSPCERCKGHNYYNAVKYKCLKNSRAMSALAMTEMYLHKFKQVYEKNVDCFISPSQFLKNKIVDWKENVKRIEVLPNFIETRTDMPWHVPTGTPYLLYAGALSDIKGVRLLLDNFQNNHYNCTLHLAGAGPLGEQVEAAAKSNKNIVYLGRLSKEVLYQQIAGAAAVLVPSIYYENFPYSVLEAFAQGKPVIGSNLGGIPELVQPGKTGWLFNPQKVNGQPETLTSTIQQALSDETLLNTYGNNARQLVATLSPQLHYERLLEIYQSVIN